MSEMSVKEAYRVMQAECGIEVGDRVKVIRACKMGEMGWGGDYIDRNNLLEAVGSNARVLGLFPGSHIVIDCTMGGQCNRQHLQAPFFVLELIEKAKPKPPPIMPIMVGGYEVKFIHGPFPTIEVCGVTVHKETLRQILDRLDGK